MTSETRSSISFASGPARPGCRRAASSPGWLSHAASFSLGASDTASLAVRLLTYAGLLLEEIIRKQNLKPGDRLPAVLPLVIHSGRNRWRAPLRLETHFAPVPKELRRYLPRLTYLLLDEQRLDLDRPELERNPTAVFFQVEVNEMAEALPDLYQQLRDRIPPGDRGLWRIINAWFLGVVRRTVPGAIILKRVHFEEPYMLEENLIRWQEEARQEGRREGRQEGQILGLQKLLLQLMTDRFGRLPANVRRQIERISSLPELRKLGRKVLRAKTLEEMGLGQG